MATGVANVINGPVYPNAQAFVDALVTAFPGEVSHVSTYEGHDPARGGRPASVDVFPRTVEAGDRIAEWAKSQYDLYSICYHIWWTRIWNPSILLAWRAMTATGNVTADHKDHVHFTFYSVPGFVRPIPTTETEIAPIALKPEDFNMENCVMFGVPNNGGIHLALLAVGVKLWIHTPAEIDAFKEAGCKFVGESVSLAALPSLPEGELGDPDPVPVQT
jgi:hypothetical protein